tara:strand:- start:666 stop:1250 length:585 start_codon:yes stop_codon:yes gene_type:complete
MAISAKSSYDGGGHPDHGFSGVSTGHEAGSGLESGQGGAVLGPDAYGGLFNGLDHKSIENVIAYMMSGWRDPHSPPMTDYDRDKQAFDKDRSWSGMPSHNLLDVFDPHGWVDEMEAMIQQQYNNLWDSPLNPYRSALDKKEVMPNKNVDPTNWGYNTPVPNPHIDVTKNPNIPNVDLGNAFLSDYDSQRAMWGI